MVVLCCFISRPRWLYITKFRLFNCDCLAEFWGWLRPFWGVVCSIAGLFLVMCKATCFCMDESFGEKNDGSVFIAVVMCNGQNLFNIKGLMSNT